MMAENDPGLWGQILNIAVVGVAWVAGEGGRAVVAGGAGGFARWMNSEPRRIRDGVIAVAGGAMAANYLWPLILVVIGFPLGGLDETPNNIAMSAFIAGALGMSFVKIITAMVEARVVRTGGRDENEG